MKPDADRIQEIFDEAEGLSAAERSAYLDEACAGDADLRAEVASLLKHSTRTPTVPDEESDQPRMASDGQYAPGDTIGRYTIQCLLGKGGMGEVYRATQQQPARDVALKVILAGSDSQRVLDRFEAERQALALMDHPGIAPLYDVGKTDEDRPYFVMKYIEGEPLTVGCDSNHLDIPERLRLIAEVCEAVQHAHYKGVVHRDLKPGNILISRGSDEKLHPTIIDFGIAKAMEEPLTDKTLTMEGILVGTPEYMSPEQVDARNDQVDARSDVYALGVVLYQVLVGRLPFEPGELKQRGWEEMKRIIREEDPPRPGAWLAAVDGDTGTKIAQLRREKPGSLSRILSRELEFIPLKALRKEPGERYDSAKAMGDDIRAYLKCERLVAGPDSAAYRLRKSIRRNKGAYSAVAAIILVLIAGVVVSLMFAFEARSQEAEVREQAYYVNIALAEKGLGQSDPKLAEKHLADARKLRDAPSDQMPIEWNYLTSQLGYGLEYPTKVSTNGICSAVACSQDGRILATRAEGGEIKCWDSNSGDLLYSWDSGRNAALLAMSSDGALLATAVRLKFGPECNTDLVIRIWDVSTGELLTEVTDRDAETCALVFLPMTHMLQAVDRKGHVLKWDADTGKLVSDTVLQANDGGSYIDDSAEPQRGDPWWGQNPFWQPEHLVGKPEGNGGPIEVSDYVAFSKDGTRLVSPQATWDTRTGQFLKDVAFLVNPKRSGSRIPTVTAIAVNGNGTRLAIAMRSGKPGIDIIDLDSGRVTPIALTEGFGEVNGLAFSGDEAIVVAGSDLGKMGKIRYLDVETGEVLADYPTGERVSTLVAAPAGPLVFMGMHGGNCRVVDSEIVTDQGLDIGKAVHLQSTSTICTAISNDGMLVAMASSSSAFREIEIWNTLTHKLVAILHQPMMRVTAMVFSPDGTKLATGGWYEQVYVWSMVTGKFITTLNGHEDKVLDVDFDQSSRRVVTACADQYVRIFDLDEPDSPLAIRTADRVADWRMRGGGSQFDQGYSGKSAVRAVAFSPDDKQVASLGDDLRVSIWDSRSGEAIGSFPGFDEMPWTYLDSWNLSFVDQGRMLACVTGNRSSLLDIESGEVRFKKELIPNHSPHQSTFTSDGSRFVSASGHGNGLHQIIIFSTDDGSELCRIPTEDAVGRIVLTPDHAFLAYQTSRGVYVRCLDQEAGRLIGKRSYKELSEELRPLVLEIIQECDGNESELLDRIDEEVGAAGSIRNAIARILVLEIQAGEARSANGVYVRPPFTLEMAKRMDSIEEVTDAMSQIRQARLLTVDVEEIKYLKAVHSELFRVRTFMILRSMVNIQNNQAVPSTPSP